jgi:hypothetical protein
MALCATNSRESAGRDVGANDLVAGHAARDQAFEAVVLRGSLSDGTEGHAYTLPGRPRLKERVALNDKVRSNSNSGYLQVHH